MTAGYLIKLRRGNIGVALGEVSEGLCAIDFDVDEYAQAFLALNPVLADTLQTHGNRGRVFWLRFNDQYPRKSSKLETHSKEAVGEFRSNGNQSIVWGIHPDTQRPYEFVVQKPVVVIAFAALQWPTKIANPPTLSSPRRVTQVVIDPVYPLSNSTSVTHTSGASNSSTSVTHKSDDKTPNTSVTHLVGLGPQSLEEVLKLSQPNRIRTNNDFLFKLARGTINLERKRESAFTEEESDDIFYEWLERARPFLRPGRSDLSYLDEFRRQRRAAQRPIGGDAVNDAWRMANDRALPPEAARFKRSPRMQLVVALCWHLQFAAGDKDFYLSPEDLRKLFGQDNRVMAVKWMKRICKSGVLQLVSEGSYGKRLAARYRYVRPL